MLKARISLPLRRDDFDECEQKWNSSFCLIGLKLQEHLRGRCLFGAAFRVWCRVRITEQLAWLNGSSLYTLMEVDSPL
jgi:hypothetical protein